MNSPPSPTWGSGARSRLCDSASTVVQPRQDVDDGPTTDSGLWAGLVRFGAHDDFDEPNCQHERAPQTSTLASGQFRRLRACSTRWPLAPGSSCVGARLTGTLTQGGRPGRESGHRLRFGAVCVATPRGSDAPCTCWGGRLEQHRVCGATSRSAVRLYVAIVLAKARQGASDGRTGDARGFCDFRDGLRTAIHQGLVHPGELAARLESSHANDRSCLAAGRRAPRTASCLGPS